METETRVYTRYSILTEDINRGANPDLAKEFDKVDKSL